MPEIKREGDKVSITMTFLEYRDLTETLTTLSNTSRRCAEHTDKPFIKHIRLCEAEGARAWSLGMGIPPVNDGEVKSFDFNAFEFLASVKPPEEQE